jgi:hypothetical protein
MWCERGKTDPRLLLRYCALGIDLLSEQAAAVNKVSFIFNFFDEIRRKVPSGK